MKKVFSTILILIVLLLLVLPYVAIAEYNNRIRELEAKIIMLQREDKKIKKQTRINTQDIEILNNIIYEKDFIKMLD
jgi:hypothetical protein